MYRIQELSAVLLLLSSVAGAQTQVEVEAPRAAVSAGAETTPPVAVGLAHETRANTFTRGLQAEATVAVLPCGRAVVVWTSARQERGSSGILARRFGLDGRPLGEEVHVSQAIRGLQHRPAVGSTGDTLWIVWRSEGQDGESGGIVARRFSQALEPLGGELAVNVERSGDQGSPVVTALGDGVLVVWVTRRTEGRDGLRGRLFDDRGRPRSQELVLSRTDGDHHPVIVTIPDDDAPRALVLWVSSGASGTPGLWGRTVGPGGELGKSTALVSDRPGPVIEPALAIDGSGLGVLAWLEGEAMGYAVRWTRLAIGPGSAPGAASTLGPIGGIARLVGPEDGWKSGLAVAMGAEAGFSIVWGGDVPPSADGIPGNGRRESALFVQAFDTDGDPIGPQAERLARRRSLSVASGAPRLAELPDGGWVLAWQGETHDDATAVGVGWRFPTGPGSGNIFSQSDGEPVVADPRAGDRAMGDRRALVSSRDFETSAAPIWDPEFTPRERRPELGGMGGDFGFEAIPSTGWTPPDPEMAVGPERLVGITNGAIAVFDKLGNLQWQDEIENSFGFWGALGADNFVFDPEVTWDPHARRFFAMANENSDDDRPYFLLAVSKDERPDDGDDWWKYRLDVTGLAGSFIDSPNLAVGRDAVLLTADFFGPDRYLVYLVDKGSVLEGGAPLTAFETITGEHSMGIPVVRSDTGVLYILESTEQAVNDVVRIHAVTEPFTNYQRQVFELAVPEYTFPQDPPQQGTSARFELFEPRFWSVAEYDGALWAVHHVDSTRARVRWYELELAGWPLVEGGTPGLASWGELDLGGGIATYFPSIHVDAVGNAAITFARSASNEFPSMGRALRAVDDPAGAFRPIQVVNTSPTFELGGRWGDYSGTQAEPDIPGTFWGHHELVDASGDWRTWMARYVLRPEALLLTADPPLAGTTSTLEVSGATPGELVFFYVGTSGSGLTELPALGVVSSLEGATELGSALADPSGMATLTAALPAGGEVILQAAEPGMTTNFLRLAEDAPLFADGFESGDTAAWSGVNP